MKGVPGTWAVRRMRGAGWEWFWEEEWEGTKGIEEEIRRTNFG